MVGRQEEIRLLKEIAAGDRSQFVVVYGRRRVGKTFLIHETFDYRFAFSHSGIEGGSLSEQLEAFYDSLVEQGLPETEKPRNWLAAFRLLKRLLASQGDTRKIVFLDELPWMDTPRSRFIAALEHFWNGWCSARKDIVLIVCGSATSWMIRSVLKNKGGLFNRANRVIYLKPFCLAECEAYMCERGISMGRRELMEGYMVFGGSPYYWSLLDAGRSLAQNLDRLCFTPSGELVSEYKRLYASVFRNPETYMKIVTTLFDRKSGLTREELSELTGIPATGRMTGLLEELEESGFVRPYVPIGKKKRGTVYQLIDSFTIFHLTFMKGRSSARRGFWIDAVDSAERHVWEGLSFERVCMLHEDALKFALGISGVSTETASWRSKRKKDGAQIDLLIDRRDGIINVCEMKFTADAYEISDAYEKKLRHKLALFKEESAIRKSVHLTLITTYGIKRNAHSGVVQSEIKLDDLFVLPPRR